MFSKKKKTTQKLYFWSPKVKTITSKMGKLSLFLESYDTFCNDGWMRDRNYGFGIIFGLGLETWI